MTELNKDSVAMQHFKVARRQLAEKLFVGVQTGQEVTWNDDERKFINMCFKQADQFLKIADEWNNT